MKDYAYNVIYLLFHILTIIINVYSKLFYLPDMQQVHNSYVDSDF